jgi:myo-inositol-1(or 4)-monophosphatase
MEALEAPGSLHLFLEAAIEAAEAGGQLLLDLRGRVKPEPKGPGDVVTRADRAAEALIRQILMAKFPTHHFLGEEGGASSEQTWTPGQLRWIVDPLDGTANYVHGLEFFAVSVALELDGAVLVGVVYAPLLRQRFTALRGGGARLNGETLHVSDVEHLSRALLVTGFPPKLERRPELLKLFEGYCSRSHAVRRLGSAALGLAYVAAGKFDGFYATHLHAWDAAAGVLLVEEAGGNVTKLDGSPFQLFEPDLLATNGKIHDQMIAVALEVLKPRVP